MEDYRFSFDPNAARASFQPVSAILDKFDDLDNRTILAGEKLDDPDLKIEARRGLAEERALTHQELRSEPDNPFYERVGEADVELERQISAAELQLEAAQERMSEEQRHYDEQLQLCIEIAPLSRAAAEELVRRKKDEIELRETYEAREKLAQLESARSIIDSLITAGGRAWPLSDEPKEEQFEDYVDEIPIEPDLREYVAQQNGCERHIYAPDVSRSAAHFLANNSGRIVTVDELARALYPEEIISQKSRHDLRTLVTSTLGPKVNGEHISNLLAEEGLVLQYGWRKHMKREGHLEKVERIHRIYRAVPKDAVDNYPNTVFSDGDQPFKDEFKTVQTAQTDIDVEPGNSADQRERVVDQVIRVIEELGNRGLLQTSGRVSVRSIRESTTPDFLSDRSIRRIAACGLIPKHDTKGDSWKIQLEPGQLIAARLMSGRGRHLLGRANLPVTLGVISELLDAYFV